MVNFCKICDLKSVLTGDAITFIEMCFEISIVINTLKKKKKPLY